MYVFLIQWQHSVYSNVTAVSLALCYVEPKGLETDFQLKMQLNPGGGGKHQYTLERTRSEKAALSVGVLASYKMYSGISNKRHTILKKQGTINFTFPKWLMPVDSVTSENKTKKFWSQGVR